VLWRSRNDIVAKIHDPVDAIREAWLALQLRIRCFQATGWRADALDPPVKDEVTISLR
jgi:hypothetical protein